MTPADIHKLTGTMSSQTEQLKSVDKSLLEVVKLLKKREEKETKKEKRVAQEKRRSLADSDALGINKMLKKEKDKAKSGGGLFGDIIGGLLKAKVMVAGLTTLLVGGIVAAVANPQVRAAAGKFWNNTIKPVIVRFWSEFIVPETKKLARTVGDIVKNSLRENTIDRVLGRSETNTNLRNQITTAERRRDQAGSASEKAKIQKDIQALKAALEKQKEIDTLENQIITIKKQLRERRLKSGRKNSLNNKIKSTEEKIEQLREEKSKIQIPQGYQTGGAISVPGMGQGDKVPAMLPPGSFVLNRNASSHMHATGGMIPAMLEPGEMVFPHTTPGLMAMNNMIPRFQKGGEVSQDVAGSSRVAPPSSSFETSEKDKELESKSNESTKNKKGADAIIAAAEASIGLMRGVPLMCATTTRQVLAAAGHPAANKITSTADLDVPVGYPQSLSSPNAAGSFAGSDMGTVYSNPMDAPPGSALLWRGTYDVAKYGPEAITHVGLKGESAAMYHHGKSQGWRKDSINRYPPNLAIDLNGQATGSGGGGGGGQSIMGQMFSGINTFISEALGINMKEALSHFAKGFGKPGMFDNLFSGGSDSAGNNGSGPSAYTPGTGKGVPDDPAFKAEVTRLAKKYNIKEDHLYGVMSFETGGTFSPSVKNQAGSGATGLIQFMDSTAAGLGTSTSALAKMTRAEQMKYVEKHFDSVGLPQGASFEDLYMSILYPKAMGKPNSYKLFGKGGDMPGAYAQNAPLDTDNDGAVTKYEAAAKAREHLQKGGTVGNVKYMSGFDSNAMFRKANDMKMGMDSRSSAPIIINNSGGGGSMPQVVENTTATTPTLPDNPISDFSIGLIMNNNILSNRIGG